MGRQVTIFLAAVLALLLAAAPASAQFGFENVSVEFEDSLGNPVQQAGAHPFAMTTTIDMNTILDAEAEEVPDGALRDLEVELPAGFVGDPEAVPFCSTADFTNLLKGGYNTCPDASSIGVIKVRLEPDKPDSVEREFPVFLLEPTPGAAARIGFVGLNLPVTLKVGVDEEAPNAVISSIVNNTQAAPFYGADLTLWGNPSESVHDPQRGGCLDRKLGDPPPRTECPVSIEPRAFLTLPRNCSEPLVTHFKARSWELSNFWAEDTATGPPLQGCEELDFEPEIEATPDTARASTPTALDFSLDIDNSGLTDPTQLPSSDIASARVTLPKGMEINPSQANGLAVCTPQQLAAQRADTPFGAGCPAGSSIGSVEVETPLLKDRILRGNVFVAAPFNNPFGSLLALYMTISEPERGIGIVLAGKVEPVESGPNAGQIVATFDDLPQLPFSHFRFHFRGGERSSLTTPTHCGTYTTEAVFTPTAAPEEPFTVTSQFQITAGPGGGPCPPAQLPFSPSFSAGTVDNRAGSYSPFVLRVQRSDGQQPITRLDTVLPPGLSGRIAGITQCSEAAIAAARANAGRAELASPSCPVSSRLGRTVAGSGVGGGLTWVSGQIYLAGPYGSSPLSVVAVTPAVAGPFDLGTVVIRLGLDLDPTTAEVKVAGSAADLIPTFLEGIPLALRDLRVVMDRPNFTLNASGCKSKSIRATLFATPSIANLAQAYQAKGCGALGFKPRLTLRLKGSTTRSGHPALRSTLRPRPGDTNIGAATVLLPASEQIDNAHINNPCTRVQFAAGQCPPGSVLGTARAETPLLDAPLEGPVYFRSNGGERELPDIVAHLKGQFEIVLVGFVDSVPIKGTEKARLRTRFLNVPDAPVSRFDLNLFGGKRGLLVNNRNLCRGKLRTKLALEGQNGRTQVTTPVLKTSCKEKKGKRGGKRGR